MELNLEINTIRAEEKVKVLILSSGLANRVKYCSLFDKLLGRNVDPLFLRSWSTSTLVGLLRYCRMVYTHRMFLQLMVLKKAAF